MGKKCTKCKLMMSLSMFAKDSNKKDGLNCRCRYCKSKKIGKRSSPHIIMNKHLYYSNRYHLQKLFNPNYNKEHFQKYKEYYLNEWDALKRGFQHIKKYPNPFLNNIEIEWHHINNKEIVALPKNLHRLYICNSRENHREMLENIIKQIYGEDDLLQ